MMKIRQSTLISLTLILVLFTLSLSASAAGSESPKLKDISGHWAESSILAMVKNGYVSGYPDGTFKPDKKVSRVEFLKLIVSALGLPVKEPQAGERWFMPYVNAAIQSGVHRQADFYSGWDNVITRKQMARIAVRAVDESFRSSSVNASDEQLMYEAAKRGIITGLTNGELGKDNSSTRAQAVVILDRILTLRKGGALQADKRAASYAEVEYRGSNLETMWGGHMNALPQTHDLSLAVKGTFHQILIIDLDDPNSPYRSWVPGLEKLDGKSSKGDYLIAFNVTMENFKTVPKTKLFFYMLVGNPHFSDAVITPKLKKQTPLGNRQPLVLDTLNKVTTWHLTTISKKDIQEYQKTNEMFWYFEWTTLKRFDLSYEGRIFGE